MKTSSLGFACLIKVRFKRSRIFSASQGLLDHLWHTALSYVFVIFRTSSLAPWRCGSNFKPNLRNWILSTSCEIGLRWVPHPINDNILVNMIYDIIWSILVQVMTRYRQATSHYLSQCWPRYLADILPRWEAFFMITLWTLPCSFRIIMLLFWNIMLLSMNKCMHFVSFLHTERV